MKETEDRMRAKDRENDDLEATVRSAIEEASKQKQNIMDAV